MQTGGRGQKFQKFEDVICTCPLMEVKMWGHSMEPLLSDHNGALSVVCVTSIILGLPLIGEMVLQLQLLSFFASTDVQVAAKSWWQCVSGHIGDYLVWVSMRNIYAINALSYHPVITASTLTSRTGVFWTQKQKHQQTISPAVNTLWHLRVSSSASGRGVLRLIKLHYIINLLNLPSILIQLGILAMPTESMPSLVCLYLEWAVGFRNGNHYLGGLTIALSR